MMLVMACLSLYCHMIYSYVLEMYKGGTCVYVLNACVCIQAYKGYKGCSHVIVVFILNYREIMWSICVCMSVSLCSTLSLYNLDISFILNI